VERLQASTVPRSRDHVAQAKLPEVAGGSLQAPPPNPSLLRYRAD